MLSVRTQVMLEYRVTVRERKSKGMQKEGETYRTEKEQQEGRVCITILIQELHHIS